MRAFIAATLPEGTIREILILQNELKGYIPELKVEPADKIHITLQFLGEISENEAHRLWVDFESAFTKSRFQFTELVVKGIEYFPGNIRPHGIWLACEDSGTIAEVANLVAAISERYGVKKEMRSFRPHITVGRFRHGESDKTAFSVDLQMLFSEGKFLVNRFYPEGIVLYRSILRKTGSEYTQIYKITLESRSGSNG
ncbi:MAG: RNA 2',3'-cyclic phosphodiesterase [Candidatus Kryptoniota bacterium]